MDSQPTIFDLGIDQWSVDARLRLIDEIRESLPPGAGGEHSEEWSDELKQLIDERLAASRPWREVMAELKARR
jgi:hypothetical protein